jgi:hypothetical protein
LTTEISNSHKPEPHRFRNETELLKSKNQRPRFDLPRLSIQLLSQISIFRLSLPATVKEVTGFSRSLKNCFTNLDQQS